MRGCLQPHLQLLSIYMSCYTQPAPLCACAQAAHWPAYTCLNRCSAMNACLHAAQAAWHWSAVSYIAIIFI